MRGGWPTWGLWPDTRPGGRTARTREAVHAAVCALFAEERDPISVREVSMRSGVHEVTIYRRWKTIESLALDVAVARMNKESPFPDSGDLRQDLLDWARSIADRVGTREGFAFYRALAAATSSQSAGQGPATAEPAIYLRRGTEVLFGAASEPSAPVSQGRLRMSHRELDPELSPPYRPWHRHTTISPLVPAHTCEADVEIWPLSIVVPAGYRIGVSVRGQDYTHDLPESGSHGSRGSGPFWHELPGDRDKPGRVCPSTADDKEKARSLATPRRS